MIPSPSPASSLPSEANVAVRRLDNGMLLAARENFTSPAVVVTGLLHAGGMDEMPEQSGLASLTASLLSRGTTERDYDALNEAIEDVGASVRFSSGTHTTGASAKSLVEDFPAILALLGEMLRRPTFPAAHLERIRAQRITGLHERQNNTRAMADLLFYRNAYPPNHPYHYDTIGTVESITGLTRDDLGSFHEATYHPNGAIFLVVGAVAQEEALDRLEALFGDWPAHPDRSMDRTAPPVEWPAAAISDVYEMPTKTQSDLAYGLPTIARNHPDFMALQLANSILGVFGMMGRIGNSVRDEQGLAYYARSGIDATRGPSAWIATAGVAPDKVQQAVASIRHEWLRMGTELVRDEELSDSKAFIGGSLPLRLETNEGVARSLIDMLYYDLGLNYLLTYDERVAAITPDEIRRVSQQYFDPERAILTIAGPRTAGAGY